MRVTIDFEIDGSPEGREENLRLMQMLSAQDALLVLHAMDCKLRNVLKYSENVDLRHAATDWRATLHAIMQERGVDLEELLP